MDLCFLLTSLATEGKKSQQLLQKTDSDLWNVTFHISIYPIFFPFYPPFILYLSNTLIDSPRWLCPEHVDAYTVEVEKLNFTHQQSGVNNKEIYFFARFGSVNFF